MSYFCKYRDYEYGVMWIRISYRLSALFSDLVGKECRRVVRDMSSLLFLTERLARYVDPLLNSHGHTSSNLERKNERKKFYLSSTPYAVRPQHFAIFQLPSADSHRERDYDNLRVIPWRLSFASASTSRRKLHSLFPYSAKTTYCTVSNTSRFELCKNLSWASTSWPLSPASAFRHITQKGPDFFKKERF